MSGRPYAEVIGDPVAHSKSPLIHNFWLAKLGIDAEYRATHVRPEELADYFAHRRGDAEWIGCNVTLPHKIAAIEYLENAALAREGPGAVNTVAKGTHGLVGANTDPGGFLRPLDRTSLEGAHVAVVGTGGAARAVLIALLSAKVAEVSILARDTVKASALLRQFGLTGQALPLDAAVPDVSLIVNASALGMKGFPQFKPNLESLPTDAIVYDLVYAPLVTPLLAAAEARNLKTIDGLEMLIGQAALAFTIFFGVTAPREHAELRALLIA